MKNQYILMSVVAAGLSLSACSDDFLEVTSPTDTFIEEYYTTEKSIDEALVAAYAPLHCTTMAQAISIAHSTS